VVWADPCSHPLWSTRPNPQPVTLPGRPDPAGWGVACLHTPDKNAPAPRRTHIPRVGVVAPDIQPVVVLGRNNPGTTPAFSGGIGGAFAPTTGPEGPERQGTMSKGEKKKQKAELGAMAGMVRMAEAAADRAEARATKALNEANAARAFATDLRKQAEDAHAAAIASAQQRHG